MSPLLFCRKLAGCTLFITGGSRGIGKAIALKAARDGANVVIAAKTAVPHPKLPGTIYTAAQEGGPAEVTLQTWAKSHKDCSSTFCCVCCVSVEAAGGKALACVVDIRDEQQIGEAVEKAVSTFGGGSACLKFLCFFFLGGANVNVVTCRNWHPGEQRQCHQFDGNLGNADEEGWPDAGNQPEGNLFDVWHAHTHTYAHRVAVNECVSTYQV